MAEQEKPTVIETENGGDKQNIELLDNDVIDLYSTILDEGYEENREFRLMILGMYGVGKTSLVHRLCNTTTTIDIVNSSDGLDIATCEIMENGDWNQIIRGGNEDLFKARLSKLFGFYKKRSKEEGDITEKQDLEAMESASKIITMLSNTPKSIIRKKLKRTRFQKRPIESNTISEDCKGNAGLSEDRISSPPRVSIWDFAGHSNYYATHHFFLSARSLYILTLDLSKNLHDTADEYTGHIPLGENLENYTCLDAFKFWMKSIYTYAKVRQETKESRDGSIGMPTVILVGTHRLKISTEQLKGRSFERYKDDYFKTALLSIRDTHVKKLVHPKYYLVDNTSSTDDEFLGFKRELLTIATSMPFWEEHIPSRFIPLERVIEHRKMKGDRTMTYGELQDGNEETEFPLADDGIRLFLMHQHSRGNLLYFNTGSLEELIIIQPQWLIDVYKALFANTRKDLNIEGLQEFHSKGILRTDTMKSLLSEAKFLHTEESILNCLEYLDVIVKPVWFPNFRVLDEAVNEESPMIVWSLDEEKEDFYFVPSMLPHRPSVENLKNDFSKEDNNPRVPTLCFYIKDGVLPPFVFYYILASCLREMPLKRIKSREILYRDIGSFEYSDSSYFTIWTIDDCINLEMKFNDTTSENEMVKHCRSLRDWFVQLLFSILNLHTKEKHDRLSSAELIDYMIKCPSCLQEVPFDVKEDDDDDLLNNKQGILSVSDLLHRGATVCNRCREIIHKEVLRFWFRTIAYEVEVTKSHNSDRLLEQLDDKSLADVAEVLADVIDEPGNLAKNLKVDGKFGAMKQDYGSPYANLIFHMLYEWNKKAECWKTLLQTLQKINVPLQKVLNIALEECKEEEDKACIEFIEQMGRDKLTQLDKNEVDGVVEAIGSEYWLLGIRLGIKETRIQQISLDNRNNSKAIIKQILLEWNLGDGYLSNLIKALYKSGSNLSLVRQTMTADVKTEESGSFDGPRKESEKKKNEAIMIIHCKRVNIPTARTVMISLPTPKEGKGTTHNTNGIIIQRDTSQQLEPSTSMCRDRKRTIEAPAEPAMHYQGQKRRGPIQFQGENLDLSRCPEVHAESIVRDRAYFLAKYCQTDGLLPGWTGWNQVHIIDSSPTDKATVQTILEKSLEIAHALNLQSIVLVMDQTIYAKAQEIRWQGPLAFHDRIIVRLGEFHTAMAFLGAVGKRFQDLGLSDIIIESGMCIV